MSKDITNEYTSSFLIETISLLSFLISSDLFLVSVLMFLKIQVKDKTTS